MQLFFRDWMRHKKQTEYLAYDVTSIFFLQRKYSGSWNGI